MSKLELRIPPDIVWVVVGAMMWLASRLTPDLSIAFLLRLFLAGAFAVAGVGLIIAARIMLNRAHTTWHPTEPELTANLVSTGVFGFSRNPTYLGMLILLIGWAIVLANPAALAASAIFAMWMSRFQIRPEERVLERLLGQEYRDYARGVRRWF